MIKLLDRNSFNKIANILVDAYGKSETYKSLEDLTREYEERLGLDSENAFEEVVADCMTSMLTSTNAAETIAKLRSTMNEKAQKSFINTINDAIKTVRNFLSHKQKDKLMEASRITNQLNALEKIADIWASGVANSMNEYERIAKSDNEGKTSANEVVRDSKKRYNKTYTDEFRTNAMIWANSSTTQVGDTKILNNKGKNFVLIEATENGYVEIESGSYDKVRGLYEQTHRETISSLYDYSKELQSEQGRDTFNLFNDEVRADDGRYSETTGVERFSNNKSRNAQYLQSSDKAKFSTKLNSEGEALSEGQAEYFKDSKVRDADGNLLKVYHGTSEDFTVFDRTKGRHNMDIQGSFFSPWELDAQGYGENVKAYYLNITNPASEQMGYKALRMFQGQNNAGVKAREYLESLGYDGVNNGNEEYIAFNSNQIKLADNLNPTDSEDVRYSVKQTKDGMKYVTLDKNIFVDDDGKKLSPREAYNSLVGQKIMLEDGDTITFVKNLPKIRMYDELFKKHPAFIDDINIKAINHLLNKNMVDEIKSSTIETQNEKQKHNHIDIVDFDRRYVYVTDGNIVYKLYLSIANLTDGTKIAYSKSFIEEAEEKISKKIKEAETVGKSLPESTSVINLPQLTDNVKSKDSTKLTPEEYARQIKTLEKENNLLVEDNKYLKELVSIQGKLKVYQNAKEAMHHTHHIQIMNFVFDESDIDKLYQAIMQV